MEDIYQLLMEARVVALQKGITTQDELAKALDVHRTTLSRALHNDAKYLTPTLAKKLHAFLKDAAAVTLPVAVSVPVLPTGARAGTIGEFAEGVTEYQCEMAVSPVKGAEMAMMVTGDSMSPDYPSGSMIFIKKVDEKAFIEWGKVYLLDTRNGAVLKRVMRTERDDVVECESINPHYQTFRVNVEHIFGWYRVLLVLALK